MESQTEDFTAIRRTAVREAGVSRHHGANEGPPETSRMPWNYGTEEFQGTLVQCELKIV